MLETDSSSDSGTHGAAGEAPPRPLPTGPIVAATPASDAIAARLLLLEQENAARGGDPALHHAIGRLREEWLGSPGAAAVAYRDAQRLDPAHLPSLQAARRLLARVGNWAPIVDLIDAEAEATTDEARKALLRFEQGLVLEERLGDASTARRRYEEALALDPGCLPALIQLAAMRGGDPAALAPILERLAAATRDAAHRARLLACAAALLEDGLGRQEEAAARWADSYAADPDAPAVRRRHAAHLERAERWEELAAVLAPLAEEDPVTALRLSRVLQRLGRDDEALDALRSAHRRHPADPLLSEELGRILAERQAWRELAEALEARLAATSDEGQQAALLHDLAEIYADRLDRLPEAIACLRRLLDRRPRDRRTLAALGRLLHRQGDDEGLLATFDAEAEAAGSPRERAACLYRAAVLLAERLGRPHEAIGRLQAILELVPDYLPALQSLGRMLAAAERWDDLVALHEHELAQTRDLDRQLDLCARIAALQEMRLGDPAAAIATHRRMLALAPDHLPTIRSLARLAESAGAWEELIFALEREAARTADQRQVVALLHRCADLACERLGDLERGALLWRRVLDLDPAYVPALQALGRLYAQTQRWEDLLEMHRREAEATSDPRAAASILCKAAAICEERLGDGERATHLWRQALALDPASGTALARLEATLRRAGAWGELVAALREVEAAERSPEGKARLLCRIAAILEEELGDPDAAAARWWEALRLAPGLVPAVRALERHAAREGRWREVVERREELAASAADWFEIACLSLDRLGDPARALRACEEALRLAPRDTAPLLLLERIASVQGERLRRAEARDLLADRVEDPALRAALLLAAATDRDRAASPDGIEAIAEAARLAPEDVRAGERLEAALEAAGAWDELVAHLRRRFRAERDPSLRMALLHRIATLLDRHLGDADGALHALRELLAIAPDHLPALVDAERLLEQTGAFLDLHENLIAQAAALRDSRLAVEKLLQAASLASRLGDDERARTDLQRAVERDPTDPRAATRLEALLESRGDARALAQLHEARAAAARSPAAAADGWIAAAEVRHRKLDEPEAALALLDRALEAAPDHATALERKGSLLEELHRWEEAANTWAARLRLGGTEAQRAALHRRLGLLLAERIRDPRRAAVHLRAVVRTFPEDREVLRALARALLDAGDRSAAVDPLHRLVELENEPQVKIGWLLELAQALVETRNDGAGAAACLRQALSLDPDHEMAAERLVSLLESTGDRAALAAALEELAALRGGERAEEAASLLTRAGAVRAELGQREEAEAAFRRAVARWPACTEARLALARMRAAHPEGRREAVEQHRWLVADDPLRRESWRWLFELHREAGEIDRAFVAASILHLLEGLSGEERAWLLERQASAGVLPDVGALPDTDWLPEELLGPAAHLATLLGEIDGTITGNLGRWGVGSSDLLPPEHELCRLLDRVAAALGGELPVCAVYGLRGSAVAEVEPGDPPAVVVGLDVASLHPSERGFLLGRIALRLVRGTSHLHRLAEADLLERMAAAVRLALPDFPGWGPVDRAVQKRIERSIRPLHREAIEELAPAIAAAPDRVGPLLDAFRHAEDRAGLLLGGDPGAALATALRAERAGLLLRDRASVRSAFAESRRMLRLLRWAAGDEHLELRQRLGTAVVE